ncbi:MAG: hypothetical protein ACKOZL_02055 [Actinomycetes bacterium]
MSGDERGSAVVETALLGALLFGLAVQVLVVVGQVQRAALATASASREVGRVVAASSTEAEAAWRTRAVTVTAARDHGLGDDALAVRVSGVRGRGALMRVEVSTEVPIVDVPLLGPFLRRVAVPVIAAHTVRLDRYASAP